MGIQVLAKAKDLRKAGFTNEVVREEYVTCDEDGYDQFVVNEDHWWISPNGKRMASYIPTGLYFDNRSANMDYVAELVAFNVPYSRG